MKFRTKITLGFGVILLMMGIVGGINYMYTNKARQNLNQYIHWSSINNVSNEDVTQPLMKLSITLNEYMRKPSSETRERILTSLKKCKIGIDKWKGQVKNFPALEKFALTMQAAGRKLDSRVKGFLDFSEKCGKGGACTEAEKKKLTSMVEALTSEIDAVIKNLGTNMDEVIDPRLEKVQKKVFDEARYSAMLSVTLTIGGILLGILIAFLIGSTVFRPIKRIRDAITLMAEGDFSEEVTDNLNFKGKDIITEMAQGLLKMLNGVIGEAHSFREGLPFPFFTANNELKITYANDQFLKMVGKPSEEVFGHYCGSMVKAQQCNTQQCLIKRALASKDIIHDISEVEKDGEKRWLDMSANILKDLRGNILGAAETLIDITEEKKGQKTIEENRQLLLRVAEEVQEIANQVATAAELLSSQSNEIAAGAEEQSAQANQVAAAVEEMNATIAEVAKNAQEAANHSQAAREVAKQGNEVVDESIKKIQLLADTTQNVANSIKALAEKSREIDRVIEVISDIADQTNLLALNATIEAASAGEAGKGFAVVAGEVKELAKQTAESTESVGEAIQQIQEGIRQSVEMTEETLKEVSEVTELSGKAGTSLEEIVDKTGNAAEMVAGIAAAAQQQSAAVNEISKNVDGIMTVSQQTAQGIAESARAANELTQLSKELLESARKFQG